MKVRVRFIEKNEVEEFIDLLKQHFEILKMVEGKELRKNSKYRILYIDLKRK